MERTVLARGNIAREKIDELAINLSQVECGRFVSLRFRKNHQKKKKIRVEIIDKDILHKEATRELLTSSLKNGSLRSWGKMFRLVH